MNRKYLWLYALGAAFLLVSFLLRIKYGDGANESILSSSLTASALFAVYIYYQSWAKRAGRKKRE